MEKITFEQLKQDLNKKCPSTGLLFGYFAEKLFDDDISVFNRRSFDDLFKLYKEKGVSEEMLMKALIDCGFATYLCGDIKKYVFFKLKRKERIFYWPRRHKMNTRASKTKYTRKYLENLYDSVINSNIIENSNS